MAYYITGDCHAHFDKLIWLARFNKKLGKEDAREGYGTVEWVDDHGTLGQEKEVSYDIVGIPCELPREKTLFKHIRESKIQSIDEMEIVRIEREEG